MKLLWSKRFLIMKMKRISNLLLGLLVFSLISCSASTDECLIPDNMLLQATENDIFVCDDEHLVSNSLHQGIDSYTYSETIVLQNGETAYSLVYDNDVSLKSASSLNSKINSKFDTYFDLVSLNDIGTITNQDKYIVFSTDSTKFPDLFPSVEKISKQGYAIKTKGNSIYILSYTEQGLDNALRTFLKLLIGYELIFDIEIYELNDKEVTKNTTIYLPNCDIVELPDFLYRIRGQTIPINQRIGMGYDRNNSPFVSIGTGTPHNSLFIVPYEQFGASHPLWYSKEHYQLCYTAHGDEKEREALIKEIGDYCYKRYCEDPINNTLFMIGQTDMAGDTQNAHLCTCTSCSAIAKKYANGGQDANSAVLLLFFNDLDDYLTTTYKTIEPIKLTFFSYQDSMLPPYDATGALHTHPNVGVYCAPSRASYSHSFYDEMQKDMQYDYPKICREWGKVTDSLYFWLYQLQFKSILYPIQTWSSTIDNCRFTYECHGKSIYPEGDEFNNSMTAFGRFKDYLYVKGMLNANSSYYKLKDFYFSHYYGPAGEIMEEMFDQIVSYLTYLGEIDEDIYKSLITEPGFNASKYWSKTLLLQWKGMVEKALELLNSNGNTYLPNYELYKSHVEIEGVFPYFALAELYQNDFDSSSFHDMVSQLASWCRKHGINYDSEANFSSKATLEATRFKGWGV